VSHAILAPANGSNFFGACGGLPFYLPSFLATVGKKTTVFIENVFTSARCDGLGAFALSDCNVAVKKKIKP
jgi:hypothetical protein